MLRLAWIVLLTLGLSTPMAAPLAVRDINGRTWTPLAPAAAEINLLVFVSATCPISARYSPEIDRIVREYGAKNVHSWLVYADPQIDVAAVRSNLAEFHKGIDAPAVIDAGFRLTAAVDVKVTPEVAIYVQSGRAYRGRIDDAYQAIGENRREAAHHDLRDALDAVLAGRRIASPETKAVGCFIERNIK